MFRLDGVVKERIDCLKLDVEGAEGLVLKGAAPLIDQYRPIVTSEFIMEMLPRVSGVSGLEYLNFFVDCDYQVNLIDRTTSALVPVSNVERFVGEFSDLARLDSYPRFALDLGLIGLLLNRHGLQCVLGSRGRDNRLRPSHRLRVLSAT
jgi:hypothetical protein